MSLSNYYVYEHIRKDTGAVFYVGKGRGKRANNKKNRGVYWDNVFQKAGGLIVNYRVKNVDEELAYLAEMELIDKYRRLGVCLVNISAGGEGTTGYRHTPESKKKIGMANATTPKARGQNHGMYGKKHTPEALAKMSAVHKNKRCGEKHHFYGKTHTAETRAKISQNRKGKMTGSDNPFFGKKHPPELMEKIAAKNRGRKATPETREKQRASALASAPFKQSTKPVICITTGVKYYGLNDAAKKLNLHRQSIRMVCNGKLKQTGGYKFEWSSK